MRLEGAKMAKRPPPNGTVFLYPYLWAYQADEGVENAKDRTCCLAFTGQSTSGIEYLVILPISDRPADDPKSAIEITTLERMRGGLDPDRPAYIHVGEYNFDRFVQSWYLDLKVKPLGCFGDSFSRKVVDAVVKGIKHKTTRRIDRTI
jgi:hypothetical protein